MICPPIAGTALPASVDCWREGTFGLVIGGTYLSEGWLAVVFTALVLVNVAALLLGRRRAVR